MSDIDSSPARGRVGAIWLAFALVNLALMFLLPGHETIPYHLIWASFALVYGLTVWSDAVAAVVFAIITAATGVPMILHAQAGYIDVDECSEIVLMGVIAALLMWHVRRGRIAQGRLADLRESERIRAHGRELATRFGSHELRTRLTIARGITELIGMSADSDSTRRDAGLAMSEIDKALTTSTNLLTLVRIDGPADIKTIQVDELVGELDRRWSLRADREWRFASDTVTVIGDQERLEAALDCLIENAVKFTDAGDSIVVTAATDRVGDQVLFTVEDSGAGIPADDVHRIVQPFETSGTAGERAGSGLGLAIVRTIAESHGGSLTVVSRLGVGTRATVAIGLSTPARRSPVDPVVTDDNLPLRESTYSP
ncbi:MAG TPA: HAMP domain-containing sensor histidine kinase [Jatrophihabitans sp.]|jgi:signal transduction histidine kinase|uniref:sensor histidine kinase n=1 Tax=Jatrophihabitans sp. TaxID=1932789 RepID=UPI002E055BF9|nr:HAMP domain-containing sensor histidine kinase [Jatrophihabitans sp.]